jgi:hypothetical protein
MAAAWALSFPRMACNALAITLVLSSHKIYKTSTTASSTDSDDTGFELGLGCAID